MYYEVIDNGKKKWMLLLHCICANRHIFDKHIEELSRKFNVLLVDLPGHGNSKQSCTVIEFRGLVNEIIAILDKLNIEKVNVWGISLGGVVAKYLLEAIPNRIEKIIFEDPAFTIENKLHLFLFKMFNKVKFFLPKGIYLRIFIFMVIPGRKQKNMRKMMYKQLKFTDYNKVSIWLTKLCEEYKNKNLDVLNSAKVNKVYMLGEYDYIFKNGTLKNVRNNKYNTIIIKKGCGHLCHLESKFYF